MTLLCFATIVSIAGIQHGYLRALAVCSVLHSLLPPWDWNAAFFSDFPDLQSGIFRLLKNRWYKIFVQAVGVLALNGRSFVWPSIAMPAQVSRGTAETKMQNPQP